MRKVIVGFLLISQIFAMEAIINTTTNARIHPTDTESIVLAPMTRIVILETPAIYSDNDREIIDEELCKVNVINGRYASKIVYVNAEDITPTENGE